MAGRRSFYQTHSRPLHPVRHRPCHRIDYNQIEIPDDALHDPALADCWSASPERRHVCRKKLWRRWRTGYYERHEPCAPVYWDASGRRVPDDDHSGNPCGARTRNGHPCRLPGVVNKYTGAPSNRCRFHGGHSTGPRTEAGKANSLAALAAAHRHKRSQLLQPNPEKFS